MWVIGICGRARAGKDAVADHLAREFGARKLKFAAPLKGAVSALFDIPLERLESDEKDEVDPRLGVTPRHIMQWLGTDIIQQAFPRDVAPRFGRRFFCERLCWDLDATDAPILVSDMRFAHENDALAQYALRRGRPYLSVRLERPGSLVGGAAGHVSETASAEIPVDTVIVNDGTLEELLTKADLVCGNWVRQACSQQNNTLEEQQS